MEDGGWKIAILHPPSSILDHKEVRHELLRRQLGPVEVAAADRRAPKIELPRHADWDQALVAIIQSRLHIRQWGANQMVIDGSTAWHHIVRTNNCCFGRAIQDPDVRHREYGLHLSQ